MRAKDYLQIAADNLKQASAARKQEADELRQMLDQRDQEYKNMLNDLKRRESESLNKAAEADDDKTTVAQTRDAAMLRNEESQLKANFDQLKKDTDQAIASIQRNITDIDQLAKMIERQWTNL